MRLSRVTSECVRRVDGCVEIVLPRLPNYVGRKRELRNGGRGGGVRPRRICFCHWYATSRAAADIPPGPAAAATATTHAPPASKTGCRFQRSPPPANRNSRVRRRKKSLRPPPPARVGGQLPITPRRPHVQLSRPITGPGRHDVFTCVRKDGVRRCGPEALSFVYTGGRAQLRFSRPWVGPNRVFGLPMATACLRPMRGGQRRIRFSMRPTVFH